ncbi:MAG: DUF4832 domain-containing protein [Treponema sp.]|nr:DUF4832 domain-containing protein [Treponema sp.]
MLSKLKFFIFTDFLCILLLTGCLNVNFFNSADSKNEENDFSGVLEYNENELSFVKQSISYVDSDAIIYNPDMGFYSAETVKIAANGSISNLSDVNDEINYKSDKVYSYKSSTHFNLVHLKVDISAFSGRVNGTDKDVENLNLSNLKSILQNARENNKTIIIRFAYDKDYNENLVSYKENGKSYKACEPISFDILLKHISDICLFVEQYTDVITAVECGMVGPWGEMHSTYYATADKDGVELGYIIAIMKQFLDGLSNCKVPLLVRQPQFIYRYLDSGYVKDTVPAKIDLTPDSVFYRLGLYNDGYLGSGTDLGTFKVKNKRKEEIEYLKAFTDHTPYGGELCYDSGSGGLWRSSYLQNTVQEMYDVHLSFLNIAWNNHVLAWADSENGYYKYDYVDDNDVPKSIEISENNLVKNENGKDEKFFQYLIKHMGYRYIVTDSQIGNNDEKSYAGFKLAFKNNGFANIPYHRQKVMTLIFVPQNGGAKSELKTNCVFDGSVKSFAVSTESLSEGKYNVYLKISDENGNYPIELANKGMWDKNLKANKIGIFTK